MYYDFRRILMDLPLNRQTAVITGAGSAEGIGFAIARRLHSAGVRVVITSTTDRIHSRARELNAGGEGVLSFIADLTVEIDVQRFVDSVLSRAGRIDILVNNAGIGGAKRLADSDDALIDRFLNTNLAAVMRVTRAVLPHLPRPGGCIINISSVFGLTGYPGTTAYAVAKAGVAQLTRQLGGELAPEGIRVNAVAPGLIATPMTVKHRENALYMRLMAEATPLERMGEPADIAGPVAFLASEDANFVTGVVLPVDGGFLAARHGKI
jgi:NAD(P)-dependent dehydrogenase (short-subunit alcohol dehydrogenase family)